MAKYDEWLTEEGLLKISAWARDTLTEKQIAEKMGIAYSTLREWKNKFPALSAAIKKNKELVDIEVENSLYKKAIGHVVPVKKAFKCKEIKYDKTTGKKISEKEVIKYATEEMYIPPDTLAEMYWLNNRKPDEWRKNRMPINADEEEGTGVVMLAPVKEDVDDG